MKLLVTIIILFLTNFALAGEIQLRDYDEFDIPEGTHIPVISLQEFSTAYCEEGDAVSFLTTSDIFEDKKSPFYHFGEMMRLAKIPRDDFHQYLSERLAGCFAEKQNELSNKILDYTGCHPYYTQQLAANVWQIGMLQPETSDPVRKAIDYIVTTHGLDYERLWMNLKRTNKWILQRLAFNKPLQNGEYRTSTIYSALKRLQKDVYVIYSNHYELEDPFFREWILVCNE